MYFVLLLSAEHRLLQVLQPIEKKKEKRWQKRPLEKSREAVFKKIRSRLKLFFQICQMRALTNSPSMAVWKHENTTFLSKAAFILENSASAAVDAFFACFTWYKRSNQWMHLCRTSSVAWMYNPDSKDCFMFEGGGTFNDCIERWDSHVPGQQRVSSAFPPVNECESEWNSG